MRTTRVMWATLLYFFLSVVVATANANDVVIFGEYYSGMPIADIRKEADVVEIDGVTNVPLMRKEVRFAGVGWTQFFAFDSDLLTDVILHAGYEPAKCEDAYVALVACGYMPLLIKNGERVVNLAELWSPDGEAVANAASAFEPGSVSKAELTFLDVDSFMKVAQGIRNGEGWKTVSGHLPENARGVFFTINKDGQSIVLSFFAPKERLSTYVGDTLMTFR